MTISYHEAREILRQANPERRDFHALCSDSLEVLQEHAERHDYRKPKNANGSRLRCFHAWLERIVARGIR